MKNDFKCSVCANRISFSAGLCGNCRQGYFQYDPEPASPEPTSGTGNSGATGSTIGGAIGAGVVILFLLAMCSG